MTEHEPSDKWVDPRHPPVEAVDLGGGVWVSWTSTFQVSREPLLWHWCTREVFIREREAKLAAKRMDDRQEWWFDSKWVPGGVSGHQLVSVEPLHLEPSVFWNECCGLHGWVRDGRWVSV